MSHPSHSPWFDLSNNICWGAQIIKLLILQSSAFQCSLVHLTYAFFSALYSRMVYLMILSVPHIPPHYRAVRSLDLLSVPLCHYLESSWVSWALQNSQLLLLLFLPGYGDRAFTVKFHVSECKMSKYERRFFKHFCNPVIIIFLLVVSAFFFELSNGRMGRIRWYSCIIQVQIELSNTGV